LNTDQ